MINLLGFVFSDEKIHFSSPPIWLFLIVLTVFVLLGFCYGFLKQRIGKVFLAFFSFRVFFYLTTKDSFYNSKKLSLRSIIIILLHTLLGYTIIDCFFANSLPDYNTTTGLWMAALLFFAIYLFIDLSARLFLYIFNYFQYYKIYNSLLLILLHLNCFVILPGIIIYFYTPFKAIIWIMLTINVFLFVIFFIRVLVLNTMCKINQFSFVVCFITYIVLPLVAIEKMLLSV